MARSPLFTHDQLLDAAGEAVLAHWRAATVQHVLEISGAPSGSVYHRFPGRDALFGALWERSVRRFHKGLLEIASDPDPRLALRRSAEHIPIFCREHPLEAKAMTLYRRLDLIELVGAAQRESIAHINDQVDHALHHLVARRYGEDDPRLFGLAIMAVRQCPYGMVRPLVGGSIPAEMDAMCVAAAEGVLALGDEPDEFMGGHRMPGQAL